MSTAKGLTGGTLDVNPQFMLIATNQLLADITITSSIAVPISRIGGGSKQRVVIIELLKIFWQMSDMGTVGTPLEVSEEIRGFLGTSNLGTVNVGPTNPAVIMWAQIRRHGAFTAAGSYMAYATVRPIITDLSDGAGHGVLVASDRLFLQIQSTNTIQANAVECRILYRFKEVSLAEYIGIVQSQQTNP